MFNCKYLSMGVLEAWQAVVGLWGPGEKAFLQVRPAPVTILEKVCIQFVDYISVGSAR